MLIIIILFISNPNHNTIKGATATTGTVCNSIAYGYKLSNILLKLITVATVIPITTAIIYPVKGLEM